jgi:hypothetical protein
MENALAEEWQDIEAVKRMSRDQIKQIRLAPPTRAEARYLADYYYARQKDRMTFAGQIRSAPEDEPHEALDYLKAQSEIMEAETKKVLEIFAWNFEPRPGFRTGEWLLDVYGIGPVIAAGLIAHIDIERARTAGSIHSFAGLVDPREQVWEKGQKRPWNARLKTLCWHAGQSFMKFHKREQCYYGHLYRRRKDLEEAKNDEGLFADQAEWQLEHKKYGKTTDAYKAYSQGKLPPAHIDARARRIAVKRLLGDLQMRWYMDHYGAWPPKPYVFSHLGHKDLELPPNFFRPGESMTQLWNACDPPRDWSKEQ